MSTSPTTTFRIASIPGDGIGTEITSAAIKVLTKLQDTVGTFKLDFVNFDWSSKNFQQRGWYMPEDGLAQLKAHDAIYFGAVGWPDVPDHISLWGLILPIRKSVSSQSPPLWIKRTATFLHVYCGFFFLE